MLSHVVVGGEPIKVGSSGRSELKFVGGSMVAGSGLGGSEESVDIS